MPFVKRVNTPDADGLLVELKEVGAKCARLERQLESARRERDELVGRASAAGATRRDVADAARISAGRVQQLADRRSP
jgi:hypothetical protein